MSDKLKQKPTPEGFNRKKLFLIFFGIISVFVAVILYVTTNNPVESTANKDATTDSQNNNYSKNDANVGIDDIVNQPANKPAVSTGSATAESVPPLVLSGKPAIGVDPQEQQQIRQFQQQTKMKRLQADNAALSSRTSVGKSGDSANASGGVVAKVINANESSSSNGGSITGDAGKMGGVGTGTLNTGIDVPQSPYTLQAGGIIPAVMISGINSDLSGEVIAQVRENVYDSISGKYLVIPQGSKLIGVYNSGVAYGQNRLMVAWNRLIYPNGMSVNLKGQPGTDIAGFSGFYDQVDNHYWQIFGMSFIMGVITGAMQYSQNNTNPNVQVGGLGVTNPSMGQTMSGSLGQQLGQTGMMLAQKGINVAPTIIIRQGYTFNIMTTADLILKQYKQN